MAHGTRGRRSGTYEIQELVAVDLAALTLTVRHAAAYQPSTVQLRIAPTPAARQMLQAMADSIKVGGNGDGDSAWESLKTVQNCAQFARLMLEQLSARGYDDFTSPEMSVPLLRSLYNSLGPNSRRSACWLLARVVRTNHPNGTALSHALRNTRFQVVDHETAPYDELVSAGIEAAARGVYTARYTAQREVFGRLGYDVSGRAWLRVSAEELIEWAHRTQPEMSHAEAPRPMFGPTFEEQVAWVLTHPQAFGYVKGAKPRRRQAPLDKLEIALYPGSVLLTAGLILHCLGENSGYNHSVLLEKSIDSLVHIGPDHALERSVKSRSQLQDTGATRTSSIYTPGGIVETLTGLTRFSREHRRHLRNPDGTTATVVNRIYVEHCADPEDARLLDIQRQASAWRGSSEWDVYWPATAGPRGAVTIRMRALRQLAQARVMGEGLIADVHGHSERTKMHYSAHVLPGHVFDRHAVDAQDAFHDTSVKDFSIVADATTGAAAELAAVDPAGVMNVEIGLCISGGNDPDDSSRRCGLGMVACFTCPNGYRTVDHIPGLLAAVELGDIIERNDPGEWETGQASRLRFYAKACLDQFPPMVVSNVRRKLDLRPHILTVTGIYMEMRHG